jgi:trimeric autotransporter adhesin
MARKTALLASLAVLAALGGCSNRTNVSAIGNTPPLYTHVYLTAQAVWFNDSATAGPDDGGWVQFPLSTPVTVDLVADSNGNFAYLATDLKLAPGSYSQVRFIPVDASTPLTASAQTLGATYNMEADYVDSSGVTHQLPLELLNPDKGLGVQASLTVPIGGVGASSLEGSDSTTGTTLGTTTTSTTTTTATDTSTTDGGTSSTSTSEFALNVDGARDLTAFTYGGVSGVLLSSHATAYDLNQSGGIQGTLTLTNLTLTSANGTPGIEVSAEAVTADGSRHFVIASTPVAADGTFTLYPLAANSSNNESYDIVIHGAGIATIIIKDIIIPPVGSSGVGVSSLTSGASTITSTTTGTTTTDTNVDTSPITPANLVSVGTILPRAASSYTANIATAANAPLPAGAEAGFYQTLPGSGEVPYVIEAEPIDPFNQVLANAQALSSGTVDSGTYVSSGSTVTVVSAAPAEGAGTYRVAASAPSYTNGSLSVTVSAPTATGVTAASPVTLGGLSIASGNTSATVTATVKPTTGGKYNQGSIMLSQGGQLVASASLAGVLQNGGTVTLTGVPGGTSSSVYYVTIRAWNSSNPAGTLTRQWYENVVDLSGASTASVQLTLN